MKPLKPSLKGSLRLAPMAAALGILASAGRSSAQSTVSYNFGLPLNLTPTELNTVGNLGLFDTDLGTLTSVVLTLQESYSSSGSMTNNGAGNVNSRLRITMDYNWTGSIPEVDSQINAPQTYITLDSGTQGYTPGQTRTFPGTNASNSRNIDLTGIMPQLQQAGGGTFSLSLQTATGVSIIGGSGNMGQSTTNEAHVAAIITYTYTTPVPETSGALLALAGGLALTLRRVRA